MNSELPACVLRFLWFLSPNPPFFLALFLPFPPYHLSLLPPSPFKNRCLFLPLVGHCVFPLPLLPSPPPSGSPYQSFESQSKGGLHPTNFPSHPHFHPFPPHFLFLPFPLPPPLSPFLPLPPPPFPPLSPLIFSFPPSPLKIAAFSPH